MDSGIPQPVIFPTTQWFLMRDAGKGDLLQRREALARLIQLYVEPIRAFVSTRRGVRMDQVDDIVQDFMTLKWIERDFLNRVDPGKGRFRSYLVVSLSRHVSNWLRDWRAGPPVEVGIMVETSDEDEPGAQGRFEQTWARNVISQAIEQFQSECRELGRLDLWGLFDARLLKPIMDGTEPIGYTELVGRFGFESPMQASNALITAKRAFGRVLRRVIAGQDGPVENLDAEIGELLEILGAEDEHGIHFRFRFFHRAAQ